MKITNLTEKSNIYTSNVFLITGTWNALPDANTLIDVGRDPAIIDIINNASTGIGKQKIERVILTHSHYDHASLLPDIKKHFNPKTYAYSRYLEGVDVILKGGEMIKCGDSLFEVIHTPGHSSDSICLYCEEEQILFAGDTPVIVRSIGGTYENNFILALEKLSSRNIQTIYFGHGPPMAEHCNEQIRESISNVQKSMKL